MKSRRWLDSFFKITKQSETITSVLEIKFFHFKLLLTLNNFCHKIHENNYYMDNFTITPAIIFLSVDE